MQKLGEQLAHVDSHIEELRRTQGAGEQQNSQDPFDSTPWIAALPMPYTKEIEQGLRVSVWTQASKANTSRSQEDPLAVGRSKKASIS